MEMPNKDHQVVTAENGWKIVIALVILLIGAIVTMGGYSWAQHDEDFDRIRAEQRKFSDRISKLEAHYEHIERTQAEIKANQAYFRTRIDEILDAVRR